MKKILVGVDGSEVSVRAAAQAFELAKAHKGSVTLAYVLPPFAVPVDAAWAPLAEIQAAETQRGAQVLAEVRASLGNPECLEIVKIGPPAETLAELAQAEGFDLVVVGSTGKGMVRRILVGSTADRLVHVSSKPVLVMR